MLLCINDFTGAFGGGDSGTVNIYQLSAFHTSTKN